MGHTSAGGEIALAGVEGAVSVGQPVPLGRLSCYADLAGVSGHGLLQTAVVEKYCLSVAPVEQKSRTSGLPSLVFGLGIGALLGWLLRPREEESDVMQRLASVVAEGRERVAYARQQIRGAQSSSVRERKEMVDEASH